MNFQKNIWMNIQKCDRKNCCGNQDGNEYNLEDFFNYAKMWSWENYCFHFGGAGKEIPRDIWMWFFVDISESIPSFLKEILKEFSEVCSYIAQI